MKLAIVESFAVKIRDKNLNHVKAYRIKSFGNGGSWNFKTPGGAVPTRQNSWGLLNVLMPCTYTLYRFVMKVEESKYMLTLLVHYNKRTCLCELCSQNLEPPPPISNAVCMGDLSSFDNRIQNVKLGAVGFVEEFGRWILG